MVSFLAGGAGLPGRLVTQNGGTKNPSAKTDLYFLTKCKMIVHRDSSTDNSAEFQKFLLQTEGDLNECDECGEDLIIYFRSILDEDGEDEIQEETVRKRGCGNPACDLFHKHL